MFCAFAAPQAMSALSRKSRIALDRLAGASRLALLLLGGHRALVDAAMVELAARGYDDFRPVHDFAMRAIAAGADSASDLDRLARTAGEQGRR